MAIVRMMIKKTDKPSDEQMRAVREETEKPIVFDEESPEMTPEMLAKFKRVNPQGGHHDGRP